MDFMVCDILASIELAARGVPGLRFVSCDEILAKAPETTRNSPAPPQFSVSIAHEFAGGRHENMDLRLAPDGLFGLEYTQGVTKSYRFFALEADRGTMPTARDNLRQSSILRKILGYREVLENRLYKIRLGVPNLVVLTVTLTETHARNIGALTREISGGWSRAFLVKTIPAGSREPCPDLLLAPWARPSGEKFDIAAP
jgi:hypothetical protein